MWEYKREESGFEQIPEGRYRVRIENVEKATSKTKGNDMIVITLKVNGQRARLWDYIVFLDDRPEITNRRLTNLFDSFEGIEDGDFNLNNWIGKVGGAQIKHDDQGRARLHYYLRPKQTEELPPWSFEDEVDGMKVVEEDLPIFF